MEIPKSNFQNETTIPEMKNTLDRISIKLDNRRKGRKLEGTTLAAMQTETQSKEKD